MSQLEPHIPEDLDDEISEYEREGAIYQRVVRRAQQTAQQTARREMLLGVLERRHVALTEAERSRITECTDLEQLERWLYRAIEVESATDMFVP